MAISEALKRLWRRPAFRRLLLLRFLSQAADGTLQVGMAAYILFSPQNAPDAWSIAGVLALTLLPFTFVGPFVSTFLDRWSRRQVALVTEVIRGLLSIVIGVIILLQFTAGGWMVLLYASLLVAMSLNRFILAGLSAGMQYTVDPDEYLSASSILPTIGPLGLVIGAVVGFSARFGLGPFIGASGADAVVFWVAALMFFGSVLVTVGFRRDALGPEPGQPRTTARQVLHGLRGAYHHLRGRRQALLALSGMFWTRLLFGLFMVMCLLAFRNLFNTATAVEAAVADVTLWGLMTGIGFVAATPLMPVLVRAFGLRRTAIGMLLVGLVAQVAPALIPTKAALMVISIFIGLAVQCFKISVDTILQAHVDEEYKGRAFIFYDMLFNSALVLAAVAAALLLPATGLSVPGFWVMGAIWLAVAVQFTLGSRRLGAETFEKGTEDLTGDHRAAVETEPALP